MYINVIKGGCIEIGDEVHLDSNSFLTAEGTLCIGSNGYVGVGVTIVSSESVSIGSNALIAAYATIRDHDHRFENVESPYRDQGSVSTPVRIGDNVWIGTKATILRGVNIGSNAVIGANSVVTSSVAPKSVVVGAPARPIKRRRDEL